MLAGSNEVLEKRFDGPGKSFGKFLDFFVIKNVGTLN